MGVCQEHGRNKALGDHIGRRNYKLKIKTIKINLYNLKTKLEKASKIRQINIENEMSAFVEVVVGTRESNDDDEYKTLLTATSFMNSSDSKAKSNGNRLRIFTNETLLDKDSTEEEVTVVKIFCSQPFNKVNRKKFFLKHTHFAQIFYIIVHFRMFNLGLNRLNCSMVLPTRK